ncbi:MAG TPA: hypothetical protein VJ461_01855 [Candidatus Nanoarchaeia archaeon]|nr:hypothetical protein [Candidatus Nanoarchaeia archaeon]
MLLKKAEKDVEAELNLLKKRADKLEKELERLEELEKGLAQHEIVLAKKITDMNKMEEDLKAVASKEELGDLKKELKKLEEHELVLVENAKSISEIVNELEKIKEPHRITEGHVMKRKSDQDDLTVLKKDLDHRMGQLEYQNKLIMKYLKRVDEALQKKLGV